jgi:hypothetical protein
LHVIRLGYIYINEIKGQGNVRSASRPAPGRVASKSPPSAAMPVERTYFSPVPWGWEGVCGASSGEDWVAGSVFSFCSGMDGEWFLGSAGWSVGCSFCCCSCLVGLVSVLVLVLEVGVEVPLVSVMLDCALAGVLVGAKTVSWAVTDCESVALVDFVSVLSKFSTGFRWFISISYPREMDGEKTSNIPLFPEPSGSVESLLFLSSAALDTGSSEAGTPF